MVNKVTFLAAAGLVCALVFAGSAQANMIFNAGFEDGAGTVPDGWTIESGDTKITWSDEAYTGNKSMLLTGTGGKPEAVIYSSGYPLRSRRGYILGAALLPPTSRL